MKGKVINLMERLVTDIAFDSFLSAVGKFMIFIISLLMEAFATDFANKGFVTVMNANVSVERGATIESFPTCLTFVWFF